MHVFGPLNPNSMATCPAAALGMSWGTMNGLTRSAPRSRNVLCCLRRLSRPPIPVENSTPVRVGSTEGSPASLHASFAAATAKCETRSLRRTSFASRNSAGSKSRTSPAILTGSSDVSNRSMGRTPPRPATSASHAAVTPTPTGVTGPMPVTTTRRGILGAHPELLGDQVDGLADRLHVLHLLLGDGDAELLLQREHSLDQIERVRVQVPGEPR